MFQSNILGLLSTRLENGLNWKGVTRMDKVIAGVLLAFAWTGVAFAQGPASPAKGPSAVEALKQAEHDWVDAAKAGDTDKLGQILADDWVGLGFDGKKATKQSM